MNGIEVFLKKLVRSTCSPALQQRIRLFYLTRQVIHGKGRFEPELQLVKQLVRPGDFVLDIGANVGTYTMAFASLSSPGGRVYSFEPVLSTYNILTEVIRKRRLSNVQAFHAALGAEAEQRDMVIPDLGDFTGFYVAHLAPPGEQQPEFSTQRERVKVLALDDLWKAGLIQKADFIKCDVEGSELSVLQGGAELIDSLGPGCLFEVSRETSKAVFSFFENLGYRGYVFAEALRATREYLDKEFSNYFFFRDESALGQRARTYLN